MADHVDRAKRSLIMAAVHSKDTGPEMVVRRIVYALGYRYRLHVSTLPGRPDLVFPGRRKVVFVHGCYWHRHNGCRYATSPKTNCEFWELKFAANVARDRRTRRELKKMGWAVMTVWQCELKKPEKLTERLNDFLSTVNKKSAELRPIGVDLFAGAGGLSLGFERAGFDVVAAVEIDPIHCAVLRMIEDEEAPKAEKAIARYVQIIEAVFHRYWKEGKTEFTFERGELEQVCEKLDIKPPKNLGDVIYTFRYRKALPKSILVTQPNDRAWLILGDGDAKYRFRLNKLTHIKPTNGLLVRKIPDATPEIISGYALTDEQALLAKVRYNRSSTFSSASPLIRCKTICARRSRTMGKSKSTNSTSASIAGALSASCRSKRRAEPTFWGLSRRSKM